ncbi:F-box protein At5g07610-like [Solanum tuberosum]|uniref:F-box protein n=1 Tax=Solanum tuberosum TaxID=4113 RepID=M1BZ34_SOLTU|nr:PREDICTED: F-box protein At5g07610-like [Solanum tuberosum]KAH0727717.1 hypothetical protein KY284_003582 [Solanum tuberosum]KAH0732494.1 hypothetical protein KY289_003682 [Solanum tuberosum]KAH0767572.1 hypothetical protein KY285_003443 [Solanum tuberosum]
MQDIKLKIPKFSDLEQPSSARIVDSIDDLLIEILLRVPIRSLLCFKTVSKRWLSIITNPQFSILCHLNPNPAIGLLLPSAYSLPINPQFDYVHFDKKNPLKPPFKNLKFIKNSSGISVLQSCNGLILCSNSPSRLAKANYYVCNPTTKHYTTLPKSVLETENSKIHGISLAFDPLKSPHYKVVCVRDSVSSPQHYQIEIYSSQTGPWRLSGDDPFIADVNFSKGVYWNGSIHWISTIGNLTSLCYNLDFESLGVMPMPSLPDDQSTTITYFGESCDHLHLIKFSFSTVRFDVYEMKRDYSEWFVKYKVDLEHPHELNYYNFTVLSLVRGRREEDAFLVLAIPGDCKAMRYNIIEKTFEKLCDYEGADEQVYFLNAFEYIESLCCV